MLRSGLECAWIGGRAELLPLSVVSAVVFVLVAGEEIGWRGFLLPPLIDQFGAWCASVILGVIWAAWHLPLFFIPGMPQYQMPIPAFVLYTIALSFLFTYLALRTQGSVLIATLFHGAVNTFGWVNPDATPTLRGWSNALCYGAAALLFGVFVRGRSSGGQRGRPQLPLASVYIVCSVTRLSAAAVIATHAADFDELGASLLQFPRYT